VTSFGPNDNLTMTEAELDACRPQGSGRVARAFCPYHGSDHQRSLQVNTETGHFKCFACGAWGYLEWARKSDEGQPTVPRYAPRRRVEKPVEPARSDLAEILAGYQQALMGDDQGARWAREYLERRRIPLELAQEYGVGYAAAGRWIHLDDKGHEVRGWKWGRIVFPHTDPLGRLVNLYGRAIGSNEKVPKNLRHDHLPGAKGYFHAPAILQGDGPLTVTEGAFDALSWIAACSPRTVAVYGVNGWRWEWARGVKRVVLALDADQRGQEEWRALARNARLRGKDVAFLPLEAYGGKKDLNEAWIAGALTVPEWTEEMPAADDTVEDPPAVVSVEISVEHEEQSHPRRSCPVCQCWAWWLREDGQWVCGICSPNPEEGELVPF
jgi:DNA primase